MTFPTTTPKSNKAVNISIHEESPVDGRVGNAAIAVNQPIVNQPIVNQPIVNQTSVHQTGVHQTSIHQTAVNQTTIGNGVSHICNIASANETNNSPKPAEVASPLLAAPTDKAAIPASDACGSFGGLADGALPKADFGSSILFGPELQKALSADGEALADPDLPVHDTNAASNGAQTIQITAAVMEEEIAIPDTPQRPPASLPGLANISLTQAPASPGRYAGPANHNTMPTKPDTPLADQLRVDFFDQYRQEKELLSEYRNTYRAWFLFAASEDNKTQPDFSTTAEHHKSSAITAQVAWAKHHARFENWKTANPAVGPIIANIHEDTKALKAAHDQKAERNQFVQDLRGKLPKDQQYELARYDQFTYLMKQSRDREVWRSRVEAQTRAQEMILAQRQAVIDEQKRIAAEKKTEDERKKKEAEAEEERKREEAKQAEETRLLEEKLVAMLAQSAEEDRIRDETKRAAEAQRMAEEKAVLEALGVPEDGTFGFSENGQLENWMENPTGVTNNAVQNHGQVISGHGLAAPAASFTTASQETTISGDVQDFQF